MPLRKTKCTVSIVRDNKQLSFKPEETFDFTKEEIIHLEKLDAITTKGDIDLSKGEGGEDGAPEYLKGNVGQVIEKIKALDSDTLNGAAEEEAKGLNRKGVLEAIEAEIKGRADL